MPSTRRDLIADYHQSIENANNETAKKEIFITLLTSLFGEHDKNGVIGQFTRGAERGISNIKRAGKLSDYGRADTQYGNVIIEFENNLERTGAHAELQLKEYISGNWNSGVQGRFSLIASDCLTWRVYTLDYDSLFGLGELAADKLNLQKVAEFKVTPEKADQFYFFLDRYLFGVEPVPATLETIRERFGFGSETFQSVLALMHSAYSGLKDGSELEVAKTQWSKFLSIAYGRFEASEAIFLIHSYLSALSKLLSYSVISGHSIYSDDEIPQIITGEAFKRFNVANFTDNDFFRWTAADEPDLRRAFSIIADEIAGLDFSDLTGDILKGVYQELVDDDTRHALGEHYTPDWLCAKIVTEMDPQPGQKILDPSCGSGSFLKAAANHLIANKPDISACELNSALYGIDVHPLSVQITKATLLMAYGKRLSAEPMPLTMNVFLANSLLLPEVDYNLFHHFYTIQVDNDSIDVPAAAFTDREMFSNMVQTAESYAESDFVQKITREPSHIRTIFSNRLGISDEKANKTAISAASAIYKALLKAKQSNRNGIWAYVLANTYAPVSLKNQFDLVIGNPPWLVFRDIVANEYQNQVRTIAQRTGCLPDKETLITHLELASLFVGWSLNYFLKDNGKLAFVMPRSIFVADQHHKMREGRINYLKIRELWDLQKITPLFKVPSCVLFCQKGRHKEEATETIKGKIFKGSLPTHNVLPEKAEDCIKTKDIVFYLANLNGRTAWSDSKVSYIRPSDYKDKFTQGATLVPRSLCFVEFDQEVSGDLKNRIIRVKTSSAILREAKEPWKTQSISGTISTKYLYETALANNIVPFGVTGSHMVVLPIKYDSEFPVLVTPERLEIEGEIETAQWFRKAIKKWDNHKTERNKNIEFHEYLNWQNKLLKQFPIKTYILVYTSSGTNAVSAIIETSKNKLKHISDAIVFWYGTDNKREALFLSAFFNSSISNQLIKPFQAQGLYGARHIQKKILELPLPAYDPANPLHNEIAALAQKATDKVAAYLAAQNFDRYGNNMDARECGRFRNQVRAHIYEELREIDKKVAELLNC